MVKKKRTRVCPSYKARCAVLEEQLRAKRWKYCPHCGKVLAEK